MRSCVPDKCGQTWCCTYLQWTSQMSLKPDSPIAFYSCTGLHFLDGYTSIMSSYGMFTISRHKFVSPVQVKRFHFNNMPTFKMKWELLLVSICFSSSMLRIQIVSWMPGILPPWAQIADCRANIGRGGAAQTVKTVDMRVSSEMTSCL